MTQQEKRLKLISDLYKDVLSPYRNFSTDLGIAVVEDVGKLSQAWKIL